MGPCTPLFQHRLELKGIVYKNMKFNAMKETTPAAMAAMCHTYQKIGSYQLALLRHIQSLTAAWAPLVSPVRSVRLWQGPCSCSDRWSRPGPQVNRTDVLKIRSFDIRNRFAASELLAEPFRAYSPSHRFLNSFIAVSYCTIGGRTGHRGPHAQAPPKACCLGPAHDQQACGPGR